MRGIKIPQQDFALKTQGGGAYARGGAYLRDTTVIATVIKYIFTLHALHNTYTSV